MTAGTAERRGEATRDRIVVAALETLREHGYAGTSARAIARTGDFNQALIFYHFGSVDDLLLAALDASSAERLARYQQVVGAVGSLPELLAVAQEVFREDLAGGHVKVLAELIAGSSSSPELGPKIVARLEQFTRLAEDALTEVMGDAGLAELLPPSEAATAILALYLGLELLIHLDGDRTRADALFARGTELAEALAPLLALLGGRSDRPRVRTRTDVEEEA